MLEFGAIHQCRVNSPAREIVLFEIAFSRRAEFCGKTKIRFRLVENIMKARNAFNAGLSGKSPVAIGRLEELRSFSERPNMAQGLPDDMPVLTFPLTVREARCIPASVQDFTFGLGHMQIADRMLMTMRLQLNGTQFYWIAEMTDPALWAALDMWRKYEFALIGLKIYDGDSSRVTFASSRFYNRTLTDEKYRSAPRREPTVDEFHEMAGLVTGFVQMQATTDIPHIPLQHVFASVLLTEQYKDVAGKEPAVKRPIVALRADGMGAVVLG